MTARSIGTIQSSSISKVVRSSELFRTLLDADKAVSDLVQERSRAAAKLEPWFQVGDTPVYLIEVESARRILHLVASSTRTRLDKGIVISTQTTRSGNGIELRRARSLNSPDLATILLSLNDDWFISRGGHPMAAGATVLAEKAADVLAALRARLESGPQVES